MTWPDHLTRRSSARPSRFGAHAWSRLIRELKAEVRHLGGVDLAATPTGEAVAVTYTVTGHEHCLACDTYSTSTENLVAILRTVQAWRVIERHEVTSHLTRRLRVGNLPPWSEVDRPFTLASGSQLALPGVS